MASYHTESLGGLAQEKTVVLDEGDALWARLRHMHIAETIAALNAEREAVTAARSVRAAARKGDGEGAPVSDAKALRALAEIARTEPEKQARVTKVRSPCLCVCAHRLSLFQRACTRVRLITHASVSVAGGGRYRHI
jgi:hypothetical protein